MSFFSEEAIISMANGVPKNINLVRPGEYILNRLNQSVKVRTVYSHDFTSANSIKLDNNTSLFYTLPTTEFLKHKINIDNSHNSDYDIILNIHNENSKLKKNLKVFAYDSDISILSYDTTLFTKTLFTIYTVDSAPTCIINGVIAKLILEY